jgi:hypothetical protein
VDVLLLLANPLLVQTATLLEQPWFRLFGLLRSHFDTSQLHALARRCAVIDTADQMVGSPSPQITPCSALW